jgi:hypothetical protein
LGEFELWGIGLLFHFEDADELGGFGAFLDAFDDGLEGEVKCGEEFG